MINGKTAVAIVTARGGSKGVPRKNVRPVAGKSLITWTIEAAKTARTIDRVVVSSDDDEILARAAESGAESIRRPPELATDLAQQEDAVVHAMRALEQLGRAADLVVLLTPTNPLRDGALIDEVLGFHAHHDRARATLTVVECEHHPLRANTLPPDRSMAEFMPPDLKWKNRQELPVYYRISGSVCVADWDYFHEQRSFLTDLTFAYPTAPRAGLDVDGEVDLHLAELYLSGKV